MMNRHDADLFELVASPEDLDIQSRIEGRPRYRLRELRVAAAILSNRNDLLQRRFPDASMRHVTLLDLALRSGCFEIAVELARRGASLSSFSPEECLSLLREASQDAAPAAAILEAGGVNSSIATLMKLVASEAKASVACLKICESTHGLSSATCLLRISF